MRLDRLDAGHQLARLDRLAADLDELRYRIAAAEQRVGIRRTRPRGAIRRRHAAIELRLAGHSLRGIATQLGVARHTVETDLADANVSPPADGRGLDARVLGKRGRPRSNGRVRA